MTEKLDPAERISILAERIVNLCNGAGDYSPEERRIAIWDCIDQINLAEWELYDFGARTLH